MDTVAVLDFGSQYTQLIVRRLRELNVYATLHPWDTDPAAVLAERPAAYILSGGPRSVYDNDAPALPDYIRDSDVPLLGICYGMQLLAHSFGGDVTASTTREYGRATVAVTERDSALLGALGDGATVWMSHGDSIARAPSGYRVVATSESCPIAAMEHRARRHFGVQFHPEVSHTEHGSAVLRGFVQAAGIAQTWTPDNIIDVQIAAIRAQVGESRALAAVSGGVDSAVATVLVQRAIGDRLQAFYVDNGLMRAGESAQVVETIGKHMGVRLTAINAVETFIDALQGVTDPEAKRRIIGTQFIRTFEATAARLGQDAAYLVQGTIYPDVVESSGAGREEAARIKTHHNVGGLPDTMAFALVEPLRDLFKDEVRAVGAALGLPDEIVWRQPFPGPGLGIRCLGEVTWARLETLRAADKIVTDELGALGMLRGDTAQAFAVLLPVKSVGVMGDGRTYDEVIAVRAVTTDDFMTADWARLPDDLLGRIANRIVNEVAGVNRVVYDITSKPPGTIEWE